MLATSLTVSATPGLVRSRIMPPAHSRASGWHRSVWAAMASIFLRTASQAFMAAEIVTVENRLA